MSAPRRLPRRLVDGVVLLDKPAGIGSNAALQRVKHLFNADKAGHTGTLDPMATGLLPICLGEATKFSSELLNADKRYLATVRLGIATDSGDADGNIITEQPVECTQADVEGALTLFRGNIFQLPPMYSALKRDGRPLYEYARAGIEIDRELRPVTIHEIELLDWTQNSFQIEVCCSKGTYIRSLAIDLGVRLGCGAHLNRLRRTAIGRFDFSQSVSIEMLEREPIPAIDRFLSPVDHLLKELPVQRLTVQQTTRIMQGQRLRDDEFSGLCGRVRLTDPDGVFFGVGSFSEGVLQPERLVVSNGKVPGSQDKKGTRKNC